ncbi:MAG: RodZ domain-containing protein [Brevinemataceae bacterium]
MSKQNKMSLGAYLSQSRENKGMSIDEVAIETNIARKYIEALEKDEYGFFSAELYLTGFLSSYAEILELDKDVVMSMYFRAIGKEQEVPLEELYSLHKSEDKFKKLTIVMVIGFPVVVIIIMLILFANSSLKSPVQNKTTFQSFSQDANKEITINLNQENKGIELELKRHDKIYLKKDNQIHNVLEFLEVGKSKNQVVFQLDQNQFTYKNGDILNADLNNDGINDLSVEVICVTNNYVKIALTSYMANIGVSNSILDSNKTDISAFKNSIQTEIPITLIPSGVKSINVQIVAARPLWVGYRADKNVEKQGFLNTGESMQISFYNALALLLGNAGAATITFSEFTNVLRGGITGETSYSLFYKKAEGNNLKLYRAQLR